MAFELSDLAALMDLMREKGAVCVEVEGVKVALGPPPPVKVEPRQAPPRERTPAPDPKADRDAYEAILFGSSFGFAEEEPHK